MNKKEAFKSFAKNHPQLASYIKDGKMTWQDFYEIYDIYGEDEKAWDSYFTKENKTTPETTDNNKISSLNDITKVFKNADVKNIQKHIGTAQKAIGLFQELTTKQSAATGLGALAALAKPTSSRPLNKFFED